MTQEQIEAMILKELTDLYTHADGAFIIGSFAATAQLLNLPDLSDEKKLELIAKMREAGIVDIEPHLLRVDVCEQDMTLFAQYVDDGSAKSRLYELAWYEQATGRKPQFGS